MKRKTGIIVSTFWFSRFLFRMNFAWTVDVNMIGNYVAQSVTILKPYHSSDCELFSPVFGGAKQMQTAVLHSYYSDHQMQCVSRQ
jgi:hypothetical protein